MSGALAISALLRVLELLERLGVRYVVGGSFASSAHGVPRSTNDADVVVEMSASQARGLANQLGEEFYSDVRMMEDALERGISFNVIHLPSNFKIDFFPSGQDAFRRSELDRRRSEPLGQATVHFSSPEDIILAKLRWYRDGGEVSERQWRDVLGVIEVQGDRLDRSHLRRWAFDLLVLDLLERALAEARIPPG
jgi:hypothetical protein